MWRETLWRPFQSSDMGSDEWMLAGCRSFATFCVRSSYSGNSEIVSCVLRVLFFSTTFILEHQNSLINSESGFFSSPHNNRFYAVLFCLGDLDNLFSLDTLPLHCMYRMCVSSLLFIVYNSQSVLIKHFIAAYLDWGKIKAKILYDFDPYICVIFSLFGSRILYIKALNAKKNQKKLRKGCLAIDLIWYLELSYSEVILYYQ